MQRAPMLLHAVKRDRSAACGRLELARAADRAIWFDGYVRTHLERDLQDLASIGSLPDFPGCCCAPAARSSG